MKIGEKLSYSRYRGISCKDRYELSDEYFAKIVNGNLICTDTEKDIDCEGNICLVTPDDKVLHIGTIPGESEDGTKPVFLFKGEELIIKYKVYLANGLKHPVWEEEKIDLTLTPEREQMLKIYYAIPILMDKFPACRSGSFRNKTDYMPVTKKCRFGIEIYGTYEKRGRYSSERWYASGVFFNTENGFTFEGDDKVFNIISPNTNETTKNKMLATLREYMAA